MALINKLDNTATATHDGAVSISNTVSTLLALPPTLLKSVDKATAKPGDTLIYTVIVTNISIIELGNVLFKDTLPTGSTYVPNSFTVNGTPETPTIAKDALSFTLNKIGIAGIATIVFHVTVNPQN